MTFTLLRAYFHAGRTMAELRTTYPHDEHEQRSVHIPYEEAYYALTRSVKTDPWLAHITSKVNKAARLASWQVSKSNFGGVNGVWRNPCDSLLLLEQLALPSTLYGSHVTQPGHKRKITLKSSEVLSTTRYRIPWEELRSNSLVKSDSTSITNYSKHPNNTHQLPHQNDPPPLLQV